ncbi:DUF421 domain-containing protein [Pseudalkalibacillus caeni]|uniref:DUF421 domain-containing protein n=1 Tax=Exobacillus caeni TaxID=2574798 RepID=A0A5R9F1X8_9BACL|nr:DUF421 domain-containing protein [Pseudalkalibacillus caeni]TLS37587.1 DUF421 domain-containing protein [Pseudalkalibacillus caeni]
MPEWIEVLLRSFFIIAGLFFITKILGKKQLSKLSFFEYIVGITIGDIAGTLSIDINMAISHGVTSILVWSAVLMLLNVLSLRSQKFRSLVEGDATVFIKDGKVMEDNLKKENYTTDELLEQLRKKNVFSMADVEFAVLESGGDLSVLLKKQNQPVTPQDLNLQLEPVKEPQTVIMDGKILDEPLANAGLNRGWLKSELEKIGVTYENVFLAQVDSDGQLTVDLFDDKIKTPSPITKPLMLASIKKCQADLEMYALATDSASVRQMYARDAEKLNKMLETLKPFLKY